MSFDWEGYLKLAKILSSDPEVNPLDEARYRTAISRAYYAVFQIAKDFLRDKDYQRNIPREHVHQFVREKFITHSLGGNYHKIGRNLEDLNHKRNNADYEPMFADLPAIARRTVRKAQETIDLINNL